MTAEYRKSAFSIMELMLVFVIIAVILAVTTPVISKRINKSPDAAANNLDISIHCDDLFIDDYESDPDISDNQKCGFCNRTSKTCLDCKKDFVGEHSVACNNNPDSNKESCEDNPHYFLNTYKCTQYYKCDDVRNEGVFGCEECYWYWKSNEVRCTKCKDGYTKKCDNGTPKRCRCVRCNIPNCSTCKYNDGEDGKTNNSNSCINCKEGFTGVPIDQNDLTKGFKACVTDPQFQRVNDHTFWTVANAGDVGGANVNWATGIANDTGIVQMCLTGNICTDSSDSPTCWLGYVRTEGGAANFVGDLKHKVVCNKQAADYICEHNGLSLPNEDQINALYNNGKLKQNDDIKNLKFCSMKAASAYYGKCPRSLDCVNTQINNRFNGADYDNICMPSSLWVISQDNPHIPLARDLDTNQNTQVPPYAALSVRCVKECIDSVEHCKIYKNADCVCETCDDGWSPNSDGTKCTMNLSSSNTDDIDDPEKQDIVNRGNQHEEWTNVNVGDPGGLLIPDRVIKCSDYSCIYSNSGPDIQICLKEQDKPTVCNGYAAKNICEYHGWRLPSKTEVSDYSVIYPGSMHIEYPGKYYWAQGSEDNSLRRVELKFPGGTNARGSDLNDYNFASQLSSVRCIRCVEGYHQDPQNWNECVQD